jgi:pyridoxamine 5'-phosphate oxidase
MGSASSTVSSPEIADEAAPWRSAFLEDLAAMEGQEFAFSTMHAVNMSAKSGAVSYEPRARFCAFQCFWAELPDNAANPATRNKSIFATDMPAFTTHARTKKLSDLAPSGPEHGSTVEYMASGGGGQVEAVWWARNNLKQWRVRGRAFIIGPDIDSDKEGARTAKECLRRRMRVVLDDEAKDWSWERELTAHFGNLSPLMRGW